MLAIGCFVDPTETKEYTGDIPFFVRFVPVSILITKIVPYLNFVQNETPGKKALELASPGHFQS